MNKPYIICLSNNKGGVSKTTTTINLGYGLAKAGYKTYIVDADPQSNATLAILKKIYQETDNTIYDVFVNRRSLGEIATPTGERNLFVAPGSLALTNADVKLASENNRETILKRAMKGVEEYDFILIDTSPNIGLLTMNSWIVSTSIIIPVECALFALAGMDTLINALDIIRRDFELSLTVLGVLAAKYDNQTKASKDALQNLRDHFDKLMFDTVIPKNIKIEEAHSVG